MLAPCPHRQEAAQEPTSGYWGGEGGGGEARAGKPYQEDAVAFPCYSYRLVGLVVMSSAPRAEEPGFESRLRRDFFRGRVIPVTSKLTLRWLPCQAPGVIGSVLELVGLSVSLLCLDEVESFICNFHLSVAARKIV